MTLWTVPLPIVGALALLVLVLGLTGRKIQSVAYDVADELLLVDGSGVSKRNLESFSSKIVPTWAKVLGWVSSFAALGLLVYIGFRFGWPWALGYAIADHALKTIGLPSPPTGAQTRRLLKAQAEEAAPKIAPYME